MTGLAHRVLAAEFGPMIGTFLALIAPVMQSRRHKFAVFAAVRRLTMTVAVYLVL